MDNEAVPVNSPVKIFKRLEEDLPNPEKVQEKSDEQIGSLHGDPRWESIQAVIDSMIEQIMKVEGIEASDTVEQIGIKFMVARLTVSQLKIIRNLPEAVRVASENGTEQGQQK